MLPKNENRFLLNSGISDGLFLKDPNVINKQTKKRITGVPLFPAVPDFPIHKPSKEYLALCSPPPTARKAPSSQNRNERKSTKDEQWATEKGSLDVNRGATSSGILKEKTKQKKKEWRNSGI